MSLSNLRFRQIFLIFNRFVEGKIPTAEVLNSYREILKGQFLSVGNDLQGDFFQNSHYDQLFFNYQHSGQGFWHGTALAVAMSHEKNHE